MSNMLRPIIEKWGPSVDCFVHPDDVPQILGELANMVGCETRSGFDELDDTETMSIDGAEKFLAFVESIDVLEVTRELGEWHIYDDEAQFENVRSLIQGIKDHVPQWREFQKDAEEDYLHIRIGG